MRYATYNDLKTKAYQTVTYDNGDTGVNQNAVVSGPCRIIRVRVFNDGGLNTLIDLDDALTVGSLPATIRVRSGATNGTKVYEWSPNGTEFSTGLSIVGTIPAGAEWMVTYQVL